MKRSQLGLYEKAMPPELDWKDKLMAAKEAGFDFLEISIDETDQKLARLDMPKEERMELLRLMMDTGIPIRSMCLSGHRRYPLGSSDSMAEQRAMEIMEKAICLADDLGIRIIQLAGYDVYYEEGTRETEERFLKNLKRGVEMAAAKGIILGFETMETPFMNTVRKSMKYVDELQSSYLCIYPDLGNLTNAAVTYGTDIMNDLFTGKGNLCAMHIKETVPGIYREVPFKTGHVDFEFGIKAAWNLGVRRFVTEFWYTGSQAWKDDLKFAHDYFAGILDRAG